MEDQAWEPSRLPGARVGGRNTLCASPDPPILEGPSPSNSHLLSPPASYTPRTSDAWRGPRRLGYLAWEPSRLPETQVGGVSACCTSPQPPVLEGSSCPPLLFSPPPSYTPRTNAARRGPQRVEDSPGRPAGFPGPRWAGETLGMLLLIL